MRVIERIWDAIATRVNDWASARRGLAEAEAMRDEAIAGYREALDQRDFWQDRCRYLVREVDVLSDEIAQLRQEVRSVTLHNAN